MAKTNLEKKTRELSSEQMRGNMGRISAYLEIVSSNTEFSLKDIKENSTILVKFENLVDDMKQSSALSDEDISRLEKLDVALNDAFADILTKTKIS